MPVLYHAFGARHVPAGIGYPGAALTSRPALPT